MARDSQLAVSPHQVLARSLLTGGSMQKSQPKSAALPDPRGQGSVADGLTHLDTAAPCRIEPYRALAFIARREPAQPSYSHYDCS